MKLIRLATDNNANFDCNFDTPIQIKPNSSLALQNCTFERIFSVLEINTTNREVEVFTTGNPTALNTGIMPDGTIVETADQQDDFFHILTGALNQTLIDPTPNNLGALFPPVTFYAGGGAEFRVRRNPKSQQSEIVYKYSSLQSPFLRLGPGIPMDFVDPSEIDFFPSLTNVANLGDRFAVKTTGVAATTDRSIIAECDEGLGFCRGSGTIAIQIETTTDNTLGGVFPVTNNGVGIGLCLGKENLPLDTTDKLLDADVDFEMYFNRASENYSMINGKGNARADTGISPNAVAGGNPQDHDIMGITIEAGKIIGFVAKNNGGALEIAFETALTEQQLKDISEFGIQPFIYLNDNGNFIKVCNARTSFSPFVSKGVYSTEDETITPAGFKQDLAMALLPDNLKNKLPFRFGSGHNGPGGVRRFDIQGEQTQINLGIPTTVLKYLGFSETQLFGFNDRQFVRNGEFRRIAKNQIDFTFSDFFILESKTLQLESYNGVPDERLDAGLPAQQKLNVPLKGDRKNILATIPINESLGEVVFETNTPTFIDIRNVGDLNIRNLKFRILDKDLNPIRTSGTTNITLLIKDN